MPKYEYKVLIGNEICDGELNEWGKQGFCLISVIPETSYEEAQAFLMREVPEIVPPRPATYLERVPEPDEDSKRARYEAAFSTFED